MEQSWRNTGVEVIECVEGLEKRRHEIMGKAGKIKESFLEEVMFELSLFDAQNGQARIVKVDKGFQMPMKVP